ncbi:hypothetical protein C0992_002027 [Termitomyces sp. T32_za158]|nr:hypothetical protein C0992_002027 [Termitomyces sp. T32_za158]
MFSTFPLLALLASASSPVSAVNAGSFADGGNTLVSAMMMFLGNEEKVYMLDKAEGNAATVAGHPAWGSVWDIASRQANVMDVRTNVFCASGMHLPNGSWVTFGGNGAVGRGGGIGSQKSPSGNGAWDAEYQDFDGSRAIRILNPCTDSDNFASTDCQWFDDPSLLAMQKQRWYSTAEALADGSIVLIGGFVNGGYINRNYPNTDPQFEGGAAENTYEFYPANGHATMLVVNGGLNGTAGYATETGQTALYGDMPFGMSLASGPVGTPAIYNPNAPKGQRWSNTGFDTSSIARLYHSSAILLPDASVLIAGSNPNVDVNTSTFFPTEYRAEIFYPPYFSAPTRPAPSGMPKTISYGGAYFDLTIPKSSYTGTANAAAANTTVSLVRGGFTTHAMNMGQRYVQLNNTFTVNNDGSITLHVAQAPNPNVLQPGPALLFVTINGIPSNGTMVIVGSGAMGVQPTSPASELPPSVTLSITQSSDGSSSSNSNQTSKDNGASGSPTGAIVGGVVGVIAVIGLLGALLGLLLARRRRRTADSTTSYAMTGGGPGAPALAAGTHRGLRNSDSSAFVPLQHDNHNDAWNGSTVNLALGSPYKDDGGFRTASSDSVWDSYVMNSPSPRSVPGHGGRYS